MDGCGIGPRKKILNADGQGAARLRCHHRALPAFADEGIGAYYFPPISAIPEKPGRTFSRQLRSFAGTRPDDIGISFFLSRFPGTVFYERVQAQIGAKRELDRQRRSNCVMFHAAYKDEFYMALRKRTPRGGQLMEKR